MYTTGSNQKHQQYMDPDTLSDILNYPNGALYSAAVTWWVAGLLNYQSTTASSTHTTLPGMVSYLMSY